MMVDRQRGTRLLAPSSCNVEEATHARARARRTEPCSDRTAHSSQSSLPKVLSSYSSFLSTQAQNVLHKQHCYRERRSHRHGGTKEGELVSEIFRFVKWARAAAQGESTPISTQQRANRCFMATSGTYFLCSPSRKANGACLDANSH